MPAYLVHGFRWPREGMSGIRVWTILQNLEDCSSEYIQNEHSSRELLSSFRRNFPDIMKELEGSGKGLTFLEQYDPEDMTSANAASQPYAFVGDRVVVIGGGSRELAMGGLRRPQTATSKGSGSAEKKQPGLAEKAPSTAVEPTGATLSVNVEEIVTEGPGVSTLAWEALADLRDKIAENEKIGWWIVYNGDPERAYDADAMEDQETRDETPTTPVAPTLKQPVNPTPQLEKTIGVPPMPKLPAPSRESSRLVTAPSKETDKRTPSKSRQAPKAAEKRPDDEPVKQKTPSRTEGLKRFFGKR